RWSMGLMGSVATSTYVKGSLGFGIIARVFKENALCGPTIIKNYQFGVFLNDNVVESGFVFSE
ncbi:hypothetical protein J1N35_025934, partial [Gossypium stocksii]